MSSSQTQDVKKVLIHNKKVFIPKYNGIFSFYEEADFVEGAPTTRFYGGTIPFPLWKQICAFFLWTYSEFRSESIVQLYYNQDTKEWKAWALPQYVGTGMTVNQVEANNPVWDTFIEEQGHNLTGFDPAGSVHHHCTSGAFQSSVDANDERAKSGLHITVGNLDSPKFSIHGRVSYKGAFWGVEWDDWFDLPETYDGLIIPTEAYSAIIAANLCIKPDGWNNEDAFPAEWRGNCTRRPTPSYSTPYAGTGAISQGTVASGATSRWASARSETGYHYSSRISEWAGLFRIAGALSEWATILGNQMADLERNIDELRQSFVEESALIDMIATGIRDGSITISDGELKANIEAAILQDRAASASVNDAGLDCAIAAMSDIVYIMDEVSDAVGESMTSTSFTGLSIASDWTSFSILDKIFKEGLPILRYYKNVKDILEAEPISNDERGIYYDYPAGHSRRTLIKAMQEEPEDTVTDSRQLHMLEQEEAMDDEKKQKVISKSNDIVELVAELPLSLRPNKEMNETFNTPAYRSRVYQLCSSGDISAVHIDKLATVLLMIDDITGGRRPEIKTLSLSMASVAERMKDSTSRVTDAQDSDGFSTYGDDDMQFNDRFFH